MSLINRNQNINIKHVYVFFIADFEKHREDINPEFDENDEYDDDYLDELHEKDD